MKTYKHIDVYYQDRLVGRMAKLKDEERFAFQYSKEWLLSGFSISPFSLPLKEGVFVPKMNNYFDGLFGVFSDSLPDGWGMFTNLLAYKLQEQGKQLVRIDKFYPSSKMCSHCGSVKEILSLSQRTYICDICGAEINRDYNASINIRNEGMRIALS